MASKFTSDVKYGGGMPIAEWVRKFATTVALFIEGSKIKCIDASGVKRILPMNSVAILFADCKIVHQGKKANYENGGNSIISKPICFVDLESVFIDSMTGANGKLLKDHQDCFIMPIGQYNGSKDLWVMISELSAQFVSQKRGNLQHDDSHIANAMCTALASLCFHLSLEISFNGDKMNEDRILFLVEAIQAMANTLSEVAKMSKKIENICRILPYTANTTDTLQSTLMSFIFSEEPCSAIRVKHIGASIFRYFTNTTEKFGSSYINTHPTGLIALILVAPMISQMIGTISDQDESKMEKTQIVNNIIKAINEASMNIITQFKKTDFEKISQKGLSETKELYRNKVTDRNPYNVNHLQNKMILTLFATVAEKYSVKTIVPKELITKIYDVVLSGEIDIPTALEMNKEPDFIDMSNVPYLKPNDDTKIKNFPVITKIEESSSDNIQSVTYFPSDPLQWSSVYLRPGGYKIRATPLGNAEFKDGDTNGQRDVANFRVTYGNVILNGKDSFSASQMQYSESSRRYRYLNKGFKPSEEFELKSDNGYFVLIQNEREIYRFVHSYGHPEQILFSFKYCMICIEKVSLLQIKEQKHSEVKDESSKDESSKPKLFAPVTTLSMALSELSLGNTETKTESTNDDWQGTEKDDGQDGQGEFILVTDRKKMRRTDFGKRTRGNSNNNRFRKY